MADISSILPLLIKFKTPLLDKVYGFKAEFDFLFGNRLPQYLNVWYEKFSTTTTFIYRLEKINFYKVYFPMHIQPPWFAAAKITVISELFSRNHLATIIGSAGSGKSMMVKHFFLNSINESFKIPIYIELRHLNDFERGIEEYIITYVLELNLTPDSTFLQTLFREGSFVFLFDGFDEVYSHKAKIVRDNLEKFTERYPKNHYLLTSRPGAQVESLPRFINFKISDLNRYEIKDFVRLQLPENPALAENIISAIEKPTNIDYQEYLKNPLLLSMFIITYQHYPLIPSKKSVFYHHVYDTLSIKHDTVTKMGTFLHERKSKLTNENLHSIIEMFSFITFFKEIYEFNENFLETELCDVQNKLGLHAPINDLIFDFRVSISIFILDGLTYKFPHRSLQEYFAADFLANSKENFKQGFFEALLNAHNLRNFQNLYNFLYLYIEIDRLFILKHYFIPLLNITSSCLRNSNRKKGIDFFIKNIASFQISEERTAYNLKKVYKLYCLELGLLSFDIASHVEAILSVIVKKIDPILKKEQRVLSHVDFASVFNFENSGIITDDVELEIEKLAVALNNCAENLNREIIKEENNNKELLKLIGGGR